MSDRQPPLPRCSVIVVSFNSAADLPLCLDHLLAQDYPDFEILLVDNASSDETADVAATYGNRVRYLPLETNAGFAGGNNAGASAATGDVLVFVNPDTAVYAGWLAELVRPLQPGQPVGMTTSRVVHLEQPHLVNTCGNDITWTGLTVCRGLNQPIEQWNTPGEVAAVSGASFAISKALFDTLGGFDERFFLYYEDTDLSLRVRLAGYQILYVPGSLVAHRYLFKFSPQKAYFQERNRWLALFKTLRLSTLLLLLPGLLLGEAMAWSYAAMRGGGHVQKKAQGWRWLWQHRTQIWQTRQETAALRRVPDSALLGHWSPRLRFAGTVPDGVAVVLERSTYSLLRVYGAFCRLVTV